MPGDAVLVEQVRLLEFNAVSVFAGTCLCVAGVVLLLRGVSNGPALYGWAGLLLALSCWRVWTVIRTRSRPLGADDADDARARLRLAVLHAWLSGALWGLFGVVALPAGDPLAGLVAAMVLTGLVGGATAVLSYLPSVYLPYTFLVVMPAAARLMLEDGTPMFRGVGVLLALYLLFAWGASRTTARSVMQSIELRLRNADLVRDLTEAQGVAVGLQRRTAEALERERTANRTRSRFVAAASHDLSQPLQSLRLQAGALRVQADGGPLEPTAARIGESVTVLSELFGAVMDLSQLETGMLEANPHPVPLAPLLTRLGNELLPIAHERGLTLDVGRTEATVLTDPVLLERALRNLLANALRHTERGGVRLTVEGPSGGRVRVRVIDTGPGIAPHQRERVFEEFVQLDGPARGRREGIGLGLAIVRRIARLLDIELDLGDAPGGGTAVALALPAVGVRADAGAARSDAPAPAPPSRPAATRERTLLVIDDEADVRDAMTLYLEACGHVVLAVGSGDDALEALERTGRVPDGIVCDHRLRGDERGTDAIARVHARCGAHVPAVLVTGDAGAADRRDIRDSGLPVLVKPCDPAELLVLLPERPPGGARPDGHEARGTGLGQDRCIDEPMSVHMSATTAATDPVVPTDAPRRTRIAVAGAGYIGRAHLAALRASPTCAPCAIVDPSPAADELARELDVPRLDSLAALGDAGGDVCARPDGVIVATPNALHVEHALACIDAGLPMLLEKPVAPSVAEALAIAERAQTVGARVLVGHHRAHSPIMAAAREAIAGGALGRLVAITGSATFFKPQGYFDEAPWRREPGAGPILLNLIHEVHNLRMLCGEVRRVQAFASSAVRGHAVEDTAVVNLEFENGALGAFVLSDTAASGRSWEQTSGENPAYASCPDEDCYTVAGTHGSLSIPTMRLTRYAAGTERSWWQPFERGALDVARADPIARQIEHFGAVVRAETAPRVTLGDGIANLRVVEAIATAARTGAAVVI